jgi:hypothetical protein
MKWHADLVSLIRNVLLEYLSRLHFHAWIYTFLFVLSAVLQRFVSLYFQVSGEFTVEQCGKY